MDPDELELSLCVLDLYWKGYLHSMSLPQIYDSIPSEKWSKIKNHKMLIIDIVYDLLSFI